MTKFVDGLSHDFLCQLVRRNDASEHDEHARLQTFRIRRGKMRRHLLYKLASLFIQ